MKVVEEELRRRGELLLIKLNSKDKVEVVNEAAAIIFALQTLNLQGYQFDFSRISLHAITNI